MGGRRLPGILTLPLCLAFNTALGVEQALFDAHLHYNIEHVEAYPPERVITMLRDSNVSTAVVTGNV